MGKTQDFHPGELKMRTDNTPFGLRKVACMFTPSHDAMLTGDKLQSLDLRRVIQLAQVLTLILH